MATENGAPRLIDLKNGNDLIFEERLITIGAALSNTIVIEECGIPEHLAHIIFIDGQWSIAAINRNPPVLLNGKVVSRQIILNNDDKITIGDKEWIFKNTFQSTDEKNEAKFSPLRLFIGALSRFSRTADCDLRFELLAGITQILSADGARLVTENQSGEFVTIARYPQASGLDRFSQRAIKWAKMKSQTILSHDTDWIDEKDSKWSLEINKIGSVICSPLFEGNIIKGYIYIDRHRNKPRFTEEDIRLIDETGPVFGDLLALYERTARQRDTIEVLQKAIECQQNPIIYECQTMRIAIERAETFASTNATVLITGETGTGKELFARLIHQHSNRKEKEFCAINCGALPENLIEAELFGHEKGAFTGAYQKKRGLFEKVDGGTIFLDEIGEMPINCQVKLLRVLQESEILPLGSTSTVKVDVRIVAATNKDLSMEVKKGAFREDLFYRLNVLEIKVPPLRHRIRDVLLLADYFLKKYSSMFGSTEKVLSLPAQAKLLGYGWPGNVRQLENTIQKSILISKGNLISDMDIDLQNDDRQVSKEDGKKKDAMVLTLKEARERAEKSCIIHALKRANGNISVAARLVETDRKWFVKLMKLYNIEREQV